MKKILVILIAAFLSVNCTQKADGPSIVAKEVNYTADGITLKGFFAYDENIKGTRPGVIVVHEWWGNNAYPKMRAKMLAELGYSALAIDMYGDGKVVDNPGDAGKMTMSVMQNPATAKARFEAGINFLKEQSQTNPEKIAAIGYCFGGGVVLHMAVGGANLNGVVSFHGSLPTDSIPDPSVVKAKMLICNGEADGFIPKEQITAFEKSMNDAGLNYEFINYPDGLHAFTNPAADSVGKKFNIPIAYNKAADEKSWADMKRFLSKLFM
jgi:dienelactone hydrolase